MSASSEITTVANVVPLEALTNMQAKDAMLRNYMERDQNKIEKMEAQMQRIERKVEMAYFLAKHTNAVIKAFAEKYHPYYIHIKPMAEMQKLLLDDSCDCFVDSKGNQFYLVEKINEFERKSRQSQAVAMQKRKKDDAAHDSQSTSARLGTSKGKRPRFN